MARVFSLAKHLRGIDNLGKGSVDLIYSQVGRDKPSLLEMNKGSLTDRPAEE